jgi:hypothetical protein
VIVEARRDIITSFFGQYPVERGSRWVSYSVTNVPRKVGQITADGKHTLVPVDSHAVAQAVLEATKLSPASVTETTYSVTNPTLPYSCWFVNFPEGTPAAIPRQLRLFGTVATTAYLPRKTIIVQCSCFWMWHNARSCARPPRCRLCGSTEHSEEGHSNRCNFPSPHLCPRCLYCHGPHPADCTDCPLRARTGNSVGSSTPCDPRALFILGVYTVRISNIELHTVRAITNRTGSISSTVCQYIFTHGVHWDTLTGEPHQKARIQPTKSLVIHNASNRSNRHRSM